MKRIFMVIALVFSLGLSIDSYAGTASKGDSVKILTANSRARMCPKPNCGQDQHLLRLPTGTVLKVQDVAEIKNGYFKAKWYKINYNDKTGWISMFDTNKSGQ